MAGFTQNQDTNTDPGSTRNPTAAALLPVPNGDGAMYDPKTGQLYDNQGNVVGSYDPTTNTATDPAGKHWTPGIGPIPGQSGLTGATLTPVTSPAPAATGGAAVGGPAPGSNVGSQTAPDIFNAPLTKPFGETFAPPAMLDLGGKPGLAYLPPAPTFTGSNAPPTFTAPSVADALNDPGYQFRVQQGDQGIQNWGAARGTLNDSSTAKALSDYNQSAASQEYANVFGRALNTFGTNYTNWQNTVLNPTMLNYSTTAAAGQHQNDLNYQNAWQQFLDRENQYYNWQNNTWNKTWQAANG